MTHIFGLNLEILAIVQGYRSITILLGSSLGSVMGKTTILLLLSCVVFAKSSPRFVNLILKHALTCKRIYTNVLTPGFKKTPCCFEKFCSYFFDKWQYYI